ncbi:MAG: CbiQ family ECF transporter T component [Armatimonadota bacterium]
MLTAAAVLFFSTVPPRAAWRLAVHTALLLLGACWLRIPLRRMLIRAAWLPALFLVLIPARGDAGRAALETALLLVIVLLASTVVVEGLSPADGIAGLQRLRVPSAVLFLLALMLRYLHVLAAAVADAHSAASVRGAGSVWGRLCALAGISHVLIARTYARAEAVEAALEVRGYAGSFPRFRTARAEKRDLFFLVWIWILLTALYTLQW